MKKENPTTEEGKGKGNGEQPTGDDGVREGLEEELREFSEALAHLVINRAFRVDIRDQLGPFKEKASGGWKYSLSAQGLHEKQGASLWSSREGLSKETSVFMESNFDPFTADTEDAIRASQREAGQLEAEAEALSSDILPRLRENAEKLELLFSSVDHVHDRVFPQIEASVTRMEEALRAVQATEMERYRPTPSSVGSFGLGTPWGAMVAGARAKPDIESDIGAPIPEVFDTDQVFWKSIEAQDAFYSSAPDGEMSSL
ncbi:unnamed protein product [Discosporangium mesarthrocarpum]